MKTYGNVWNKFGKNQISNVIATGPWKYWGNVSVRMASWIEPKHYPVITVERNFDPMTETIIKNNAKANQKYDKFTTFTHSFSYTRLFTYFCTKTDVENNEYTHVSWRQLPFYETDIEFVNPYDWYLINPKQAGKY